SRAHCENPSNAPGLPRTYAGPRGVGEYRALGGATEPQLDSLCHHWSEERFQTELMTPSIFISGGGDSHQPLSRMSIGVFEDLGYEVNYAASDFYALPGPGLHPGAHEHVGEVFEHSEPIVLMLP